MKINVKIGEHSYTVEIEDLNARPIVAIVDGERFEVTPDNGKPLEVRSEPSRVVRKEAGAQAASAPKAAGGNLAAPVDKFISAPLPGTVAEILVKAGDEVKSGQVVFVIDAMKMKNSVRAARDGKVSAVLASAGQTVPHKHPLLEFE